MGSMSNHAHTQPSLVQLAERVLERARAIEAALPAPPTIFHDTIEDLPDGQRATQVALCDDLDLLRDLVGGRSLWHGRMNRHMGFASAFNAACWHFIYHFKIPQAVPLDGRISYMELAAKCNVNEAQLRRMLRLGMTIHLFHEPEPGYIAHTADTRALATDDVMFEMCGFTVEEPCAASFDIVAAMEKWPGAQELNQTAWNLRNGTDEPFYPYVSKDPARLRRLEMSMRGFSCGSESAARAMALAYPWQAVAGGKGVLVDVGGGSGHISATIAKHNPDMRFIVQDLPKASDEGQRLLAPELRDRVSFMLHNYLEPQPVKDADFYFFSMVFHNNSDKYAELMLRQVVPALKPGAKVLWCDRVVPERGTVSEAEYKQILLTDMAMMVLFNSKERTEEEEIEVFRRADERFRHTGTYKLEGDSPFVIVEATWTP